MKRKKIHKFFSAIMALAMVFTMLAPMNASANIDALPFKQGGTSESIMQAKAAVAEQLNLLDGEASLHKDLQSLSGNEEVEVIVHLSERPVALEQGIQELAGKTFTRADAVKADRKVRDQHAFFKKEINANKISFKEGFSYTTVLNGFSATVKANDLKKLLSIQGVVLIEPVVEMHALESTLTPGGTVEAAMDTSISFLGIEKIWDKGFKGKGIKVGVLDTGIDYNHPDFEGIYKGGWNFIPHTGSDYARPRADNDPYETTPADRPSNKAEFNADGSSFYTSHGTHVAGTIAAIGKNEYNISGIAPEVDLYAYRVLGAYGSGSNAGVIAGINKAVEEKMDVINLSLGGGNNSSTTADTIAINNAMLAGTLAVSATGNSGPGRGTIGTPAAAALGIAVGNTTNPEANYDANVSVIAGDYTKISNIKLMGTTFGVDVATQLAGEFDVAAVPGLGAPADYNGLDVDGKFVLVSRGSIAFVDKIAAAKAAGAAGLLIHNFGGGTNAPNPSGTFLGDDFGFLPTFDMSQTEGDALRTALASNAGKVSFANINTTFTTGDEVNSSSSRGPTIPHFDIKPDVSAPGTNIMSTIPMYGKDNPGADYSKAFSRKTGTSMATPHVAGIAALVMHANPNWTAFDVKVAISNTAKILDVTKYDVFAQGPGRVQPFEAAFPKALAYAEDTVVSDGKTVANVKGTVTFGILNKVKDEAVSVTKQVRVKNLSGGSGDYTATVQVTKAFANAKVTIDKPSFTLNGEQLLNITLTAPKTAIKAGDELLGYIHITSGDTNLSLPFAADFSPVVEIAPITKYELTETDLSFNGDGVKDEGRLEFTLNRNVGTNYVELWDIMNQDGGYYGDGFIGYLHAGNSLAAGSYYLDIDGEYTPWGGSGAKQIPDGVYTVDFTALNLGAGPAIIEAWDGPLFVKSTPALIKAEETHEAENSTYEFTGQVLDSYIEWQKELSRYVGLGYNVNTKLATTFEVQDEDGNVVSSGPVNLAQDGSFTFNVTGLKDGINTVIIFVNDAAGNKAEYEYTVVAEVESDVISYATNKDSVTLQVGDTESLTVTETTTKPDGTVTEKDVTADATFSSADESIAHVNKGLVTAVGAGETQVTITYEDFTANVLVTVEEVVVNEQIYVVKDGDIASQINDKKAKEVVISLPKLERNEMKVEFGSPILAALELSKKDVILLSEGASYTFTKKAIEKLAKDANGSLTIILGKADASYNSKAVSDAFAISFARGTGDNLVPLNNYNEKIDIALPINASKVIKTNKLSVIDLNTNKTEKGKYNKDIFEFTANGGGNFIVVND
ncbi:S8 family serine peptidase [Sporosarcina sp. FA9]|uniref:S8 family serine peptidase n=1 Tax=Sporosarcina sp. FA9 TaxID=3413030 RepID=UPI003F65FBCC